MIVCCLRYCLPHFLIQLASHDAPCLLFFCFPFSVFTPASFSHVSFSQPLLSSPCVTTLHLCLPTVLTLHLHPLCYLPAVFRSTLTPSPQSFTSCFFLLCGDTEFNPGPSDFTVCTLNICSILHPVHSAALSDIIYTHNPDLFSPTETWIKPSTTSAELHNCTPPNYSLLSTPRNDFHSTSGGGTGFLIREPFTQLPTSTPDFSSFESSSVTLQLPHSKISVFNVYRLPSSSTHAKPYSIFLEDFNSFLSFAATTPHKFIITGNFNIHLDNPTDHLISQLLSLLSSFNLSQHVNFPTHNKSHILDLVITSSDSSLVPSVSSTHCSPSDHYPAFTRFSVNPTPLPLPTLHTFCQLHSIDTDFSH